MSIGPKKRKDSIHTIFLKTKDKKNSSMKIKVFLYHKIYENLKIVSPSLNAHNNLKNLDFEGDFLKVAENDLCKVYVNLNRKLVSINFCPKTGKAPVEFCENWFNQIKSSMLKIFSINTEVKLLAKQYKDKKNIFVEVS